MGHRNVFEVTSLLPGYRASALVNRDTVFKPLRFPAINPRFYRKPLITVCHSLNTKRSRKSFARAHRLLQEKVIRRCGFENFAIGDPTNVRISNEPWPLPAFRTMGRRRAQMGPD